VIVATDGKPIANLQAFSDLLKTLSTGQTVAVSLIRDGNEQRASVTLVAR